MAKIDWGKILLDQAFGSEDGEAIVNRSFALDTNESDASFLTPITLQDPSNCAPSSITRLR